MMILEYWGGGGGESLNIHMSQANLAMLYTLTFQYCLFQTNMRSFYNDYWRQKKKRMKLKYDTERKELREVHVKNVS